MIVEFLNADNRIPKGKIFGHQNGKHNNHTDTESRVTITAQHVTLQRNFLDHTFSV